MMTAELINGNGKAEYENIVGFRKISDLHVVLISKDGSEENVFAGSGYLNMAECKYLNL